MVPLWGSLAWSLALMCAVVLTDATDAAACVTWLCTHGGVLAVTLVVGFSFACDCLIEYISLYFFTTGSDYVRQYVRKHKGYGWTRK